jgi:hypothetical protein
LLALTAVLCMTEIVFADVQVRCSQVSAVEGAFARAL